MLLAGAGMALPTYMLGVAVHEGSHALAVKMLGGELLEFRVLPFRHEATGAFYFGYVSYRGRFSPAEQTFFYLAPKLADLLLLGTYASLVATDTLPKNHYGQLALAVLATGFWVDFSKDIPAFWPTNDVVKAYQRIGATTEWRRLPLRLLHAALSAGAAYAIFRGYREVFDHDTASPPMLLPLLRASF